MRSMIAGTGSYLPEKILTNADLMEMVDTTDEWIVSRTGVRQRHLASDDQATSDLATAASLKALEMAGKEPGDLDLIIVATITPDHFFPSTAALVQKNIGASTAAAFDLEAACTGFIYGLSVADQFIKSGMYETILVVGAEVLSRYIDWEDRSTAVLFGDGAGAAVLVPSQDSSQIISTHLHCDGSMTDLLCAPGGGSRMPPSYEMIDKKLNTIKMKGNETFKIAVTKLSEVVDEVLKHNNITEDEIDFLIPHQANLRIILATARKLKLSEDKVVITVDRHGNTSAASVPLAMDDAIRNERIARGDTLLLEAFGGGLTWGAALVRW
ncbi:MAG: beta-ketoacyl-ACP synthase III [bacterium]